MIIGWREWVGLPDLGLPLIKAKVDTGARTSSLHAFDLETFEMRNHLHVRFRLHPLRSRPDIVVNCEAPVVDHRAVSDSSGHREWRYVISSTLVLGTSRFPIEITLNNRETMAHRMLLGRSAMHSLTIDPRRAFMLGFPKRIVSLYQAPTPPTQRTTAKKSGRRK